MTAARMANPTFSFRAPKAKGQVKPWMLPRTTKDEAMQLNVRMPPDELKSLDVWIKTQPAPRPKRAEAIRRLVGQALVGGAQPTEAGGQRHVSGIAPTPDQNPPDPRRVVARVERVPSAGEIGLEPRAVVH